MLADSIFGDLLPVRKTMRSLPGMITNPLVNMISMQNYYIAMYDAPETLHKIMDMAATVYERYYDYLEQNGLLLPTNGTSVIGQESFAFTDELPAQGSHYIHKTGLGIFGISGDYRGFTGYVW